MGTKDVKGFDLAKHQELVGGFTKAEEDLAVEEVKQEEIVEKEETVESEQIET